MTPDPLAALDEGPSLPETLPASPWELFRAWFEEAEKDKRQPNPNCMYLATVDPDGQPSVRTVLCRGIDPGERFIVFYTNYLSRKGLALDRAGRGAVLFHWDHADRQVRMEGLVSRSPAAESDRYFASRHWVSRLGAWASEQSRPIESRQALLEKVGEAAVKLDLDLAGVLDGKDPSIPRPPHWGGYRLWPTRVELWVGGTGRVHDRAAWTREVGPAVGDEGRIGPWAATRLQP